MHRDEVRFQGHILGIGTTSGHRFVVGMWRRSPFGAFTDVFVERPDGSSVLIAPDARVADYVASTYRFDSTLVAPVSVRRRQDGVPVRRRPGRAPGRAGGTIEVAAGPMAITVGIGGVTPLGRLLRLVPRRLMTDPRWLTLIDPAARVLVPGAGTAGSAGGGRREYYGVTGSHAVTRVAGTWDGAPLGTLARLDPPVRFGFASTPATPQIVTVTTIIHEPRR